MEIDKYYSEFLKLIKEHKSIAVFFAISIPLGVAATVYFSRKSRSVRYAGKFIGKEEVSGNEGFKDPEFDALMRKYGDFSNGQAWCMSFVKMVWIKKYGKKYEDILNKLITPSTQTTWQNFENDKSGKFKTGKEAKKGAIVIWQRYRNGVPEWKGHAGIVQRVNKDNFETIEGNTNDAGGREGYIVAEKIRNYDWNNKNGLRLKGFIYKKTIL